MSKTETKKTTARKPRKPSQTARILENVEMLVALYEEQGSPSRDGFDLSVVEQSVESSLQRLIDQRMDEFEQRVSETAGATTTVDWTGWEESMTTAIDKQLDKKIDQLEASILAKLESKLDARVGEDSQANDKFKSLEEAIEFQTTAVEQTAKEIKSDVETVLASLAALDSSPEPRTTGSSTSEASETAEVSADEESSSHWQQQKQAMLAKYGIDPDFRPLEDSDSDAEGKNSKERESSTAEKLVDLHQTIDSLSAQDKDAVEKLKRDLNSKLREAEVELSINRARLSQERAELEQRQAELEQRTADLESKLETGGASDGKSTSSKASFLGRFTRHLGK